MKKNPVGWFEIYVRDMARAKKFYSIILKTELHTLQAGPEIEMCAFPMDMETVGAPGALVKMEGMHPGGNSVLIYFKCDDCGVEEQRVAEAGGKVHRPKKSIGEHGFISLGFDTEGNMFGLHSMK